MADLNALLSASRVANQIPTQEAQVPSDNATVFDMLKGVAGTGLGAVASVGNFLDLPGSSVRDLLAGKGLGESFDQWLTPLSDENRTTGRQLIEKHFGVRKNRETGITGWLSDPGEGLRDLAGFAAEVVTDPFGPVTKSLMVGTTAGKALAQSASRAHPLMKTLGRGVANVFDKIPGRVQEAAFRAPYRGLKSLFNAPTMGVTNKVIQPMAEAAHAAATKATKEAALNNIDLLQTADRLGWHLTPDTSLDAKDLTSWSNPKSQLQVNARELALYRYREMGDSFDPSVGGYRKGDIVTIGETPDLKEVEWVNQTPQGVQVKLANHDQLLSDGQLKKAFMQTEMDVPPEIRDLADLDRANMDALNEKLNELGVLGAGRDHDVTQYFSPREKAAYLKHVEEVLGVRVEPDRRQFAGLTSTLTAVGGRDMVYKGNHDGTAGVIDLFADPYHQSQIEAIDSKSIESPVLIKGVKPKIMLDKAGPRHIESLAESLDLTADELWDAARIGQKSHLNTYAAAVKQPDGYHIVENNQQIGRFRTAIVGDGEASIYPELFRSEDFDRGVLQDVLPDVERELQQSGVKRASVITSSNIGDSFWKDQGYRPDTTSPSGQERWIKDLYTAGPKSNPGLSAARMVSQDEVVNKLKALAYTLQAQVDAGDLKGVQPGQGWWKRYDDLRDPTGEKVLNFNPEKDGFVKLDSTNIQRGLFQDPNDYDIAMPYILKGRDVYYGYKQPKKGVKAVSMIVAPTSKAKLMLKLDKFIKELPEQIKSTPLLKTEATYDQLHQSITRNWGHKIDRWMPELDDKGIAKAADFTQEVHAATPGEWRKSLPDLIDRVQNGKPLSKPTSALLRLDDDSLQALGFSPENIDMVTEMRQTVADATGEEIQQNVSIPLVDRHRALAEEVADHIEKRVAPIFNRSSAIAGYDYARKNAAAAGLLESMKGTLMSLFKENGGVGVAKDITVKYDPTRTLGTTLGEALDEEGGAMFAGKVSPKTFLESTRKTFVKENVPGFFETTDPQDVINQIEILKGIRADKQVFDQMRTLNEISSAADLPELNWLQRGGQTLMSWFKSGALSVTPATAVRDGFSSFVNGVLLGDMNPITALAQHGPKGSAFARGNLVDPGEGIPEIIAFLAKRGREDNALNRAQAFQAFYAAHHFGGGVNPNVIKADTTAMAGADATAAFGKNIPNYGDPKTMMDMLTKQPAAKVAELYNKPGKFNLRELMDPISGKSPFNPANTAGSWKFDKATNRWVQNSDNNVMVGMMNSFRGHIDTTVRATYIFDRLAKTKSLADAFANSDRVLMNANPRNFSRFEHQYMKTLVPFYSFMRQSIPMFLKELAVNPGGWLGRAVRGTRLGQGNEDGYVPFQYQDTTSIPLGQNDDGSYKYLTSFGLMHEDAVAYAGNVLQGDLRGLMQKAISSGNPALKWMIEYSTNTSLYSQGPMGGRRLDDLDPSIGRLLTNLGVQGLDQSGRAAPVLGSAALESIAAASPLSRMISMAKIATNDPKRAGTVEKLTRLLTGVRTENVSPEQITRDIRDRVNALQIEHGARPLTTVIGAKGIADELRTRGDFENADKLDQYASVLTFMRKQERMKKKAEK